MLSARRALRRTTAALLAVLLGGAFLPGPASADIRLEGVRWRAAEGLRGANGRYHDVKEVELRKAVLKARLRANVKVTNRSGSSQEGIVLRYAVSARLAPVGTDEPGSWTVPFLVEQRRIPRIGAHQTIESRLDPTIHVRLFVKRMKQVGHLTREFKLQVMVEPRRADRGPIQVIESFLKVAPDQ